jgi:serralysin
MLVQRNHLGLMCGLLVVATLTVAARADNGNDLVHILPAPTLPTDPIVPPATTFSLSVPAYSSLPSAAAKLYLDFDGDVNYNWGGYVPGITPAYSTDADTSTFSQQELDNIHEIWMRTSEMFSPFNIDVTTVQPADQSTRHYLRVVVGGDGKNGADTYWVGQRAGGIAYIGGFTNGNLPNVEYVFPGNLGNGKPVYTADGIAHEAGHGFGLYHQSTYDQFGAKLEEYNPGTPDKAPIMGLSYYSTRAMWWSGKSLSAQTTQDDLDVLSSPFDAFGYRPLDHGNSIATAQPLPISGVDASASGVIETTDDGAYYSFTTGDASFVTFSVSGAPFAGMLDPSLALYDANGNLIQLVATSSLSELLSATLDAGSYDIAVLSAGNYGDIGQYFLTGMIQPADSVPEPGVAASLTLAITAIAFKRKGRGRPRGGATPAGAA